MITKTGHTADLFPKRTTAYDLHVVLNHDISINTAQEIANRLDNNLYAYTPRAHGKFGLDKYFVTPEERSYPDQDHITTDECERHGHTWAYWTEDELTHRQCTRCGARQMAAG